MVESRHLTQPRSVQKRLTLRMPSAAFIRRLYLDLGEPGAGPSFYECDRSQITGPLDLRSPVWKFLTSQFLVQL